MYRAKAKSIAQAVSRNADGHMFSLGANYGTKVQRRLVYVEIAEKTQDWLEFVRTKRALHLYGSIRAAVISDNY